jgi:glutamyl-tRNA synthetase
VEYGTGNCCHFPPEYKGLLSPLQPLPPLPSEKNNGVGQYKTVNWRFRVPEKADERAISFDDVYFGQQTFHGGIDFGDFLIWRSDGYPSYELAVVVDDIIMGVREVVRGQDLLLSTARQLLVIKALFGLDYRDEKCWWPAFPRDHLRWSIEHCDMLLEEYSQMEKEEEISEQDMLSLESTKFRIPRYFHCPLVLDEHGKRMAKRNFSKGLRKLREEGVSPEDIKRKYFNSTLCRVSG